MKKYKNVLTGFFAVAMISASVHNFSINKKYTDIATISLFHTTLSMIANAVSGTESGNLDPCPGFKRETICVGYEEQYIWVSLQGNWYYLLQEVPVYRTCCIYGQATDNCSFITGQDSDCGQFINVSAPNCARTSIGGRER